MSVGRSAGPLSEQRRQPHRGSARRRLDGDPRPPRPPRPRGQARTTGSSRRAGILAALRGEPPPAAQGEARPPRYPDFGGGGRFLLQCRPTGLNSDSPGAFLAEGTRTPRMRPPRLGDRDGLCGWRRPRPHCGAHGDLPAAARAHLPHTRRGSRGLACACECVCAFGEGVVT